MIKCVEVQLRLHKLSAVSNSWTKFLNISPVVESLPLWDLLIMNCSSGSSTLFMPCSSYWAAKCLQYNGSVRTEHFPTATLNFTKNFPWSSVLQKGFKKSSEWKGCYASSIALYGYAVKHAIRQQKCFTFYCTLRGPASGFHKAVSAYHTWLSDNPVVGHTTVPWR